MSVIAPVLLILPVPPITPVGPTVRVTPPFAVIVLFTFILLLYGLVEVVLSVKEPLPKLMALDIVMSQELAIDRELIAF